MSWGTLVLPHYSDSARIQTCLLRLLALISFPSNLLATLILLAKRGKDH